MLQLVAAMRRKILKLTTKRVVDESSLGGSGQDHPDHDHGHDHEAAAGHDRVPTGGPILYRILRAPISLLGCISAHNTNAVDGASASYSYEVNYLMVRDSMRYAIYV
ncbi:hypothetical protein ACLOJK_035755 [Asimina triloba]